MDGFSSAGTLFTEDFDRPGTAPQPEVIEPTYTVAELTEARETAWREGHAAGLNEAAAADTATLRQAMQDIAAQFATECGHARERAEQAAEAIAGLLLHSLAVTFPTLCERYGDAEVRAVARTVLPALTQEASITLRAHPRSIAALAPEIARLDPDIAARMRMTESDAMQPGDIRIAWHNGAAVRDAAALWEQVAAILAPAGLLRADAAIRETADVD